MGASLGGEPCHSGVLEPEFLSQGLNFVFETLILSQGSVAAFGLLARRETIETKQCQPSEVACRIADWTRSFQPFGMGMLASIGLFRKSH